MFSTKGDPMPRLSKELTTTRDALIRNLVTQFPDKSLADLNDELKIATGYRMASYRLSKLRQEARDAAKARAS
jgi:hypothetical protein